MALNAGSGWASSASLEGSDLDPDLVVQRRVWREATAVAGTREPNAMTLATADAAGVPSARVAILRGLDDSGLTWYTKGESLKGRGLWAQLTWEPVAPTVCNKH